MRIATWNVERLKHRRSLGDILAACEQAKADMLILTETDEQVCPPSLRYCFQTPKLAEIAPEFYKPTENHVSVFTNYPMFAAMKLVINIPLRVLSWKPSWVSMEQTSVLRGTDVRHSQRLTNTDVFAENARKT